VKNKVQFGAVLLAATICVLLPGSAWAQKPPASNTPHADRPPQTHAAPAHPQNQNPNRPQANTNRPPANYSAPHSSFNNQGRGGNTAGGKLTPRQQLGVGAARPWVDQMRSFTPQQREHVLQNSPKFQSLSPEQQSKIRQQFNQWDRLNPQQRADLQAKEQTWRNLTPEQRQHIKNDVLPKWRQMPWERQQVIQQKLGVLQNMPESSRNQRLNDPNFTRGMSDEDKATLHDLSHLHVGGAPDAPSE
jgi:hypothetical protein